MRTVVSLLLIVIVATGIFVVTYIHSAVKPMDKNATEFVTVEIPAGSSNREIGAILEKKGLVKNGRSLTTIPSSRTIAISNLVISICKRAWI